MTYKLKIFDPTLLHHYWEHVTCLHCCDYFVDPKLAPCGHTLCHLCWKSHRQCPLCSVKIVRDNLKLNTRIQILTENVKKLVNEYEKLFHVNFYEAINECNSSKNVSDWLKNSQNEFAQCRQSSGHTSQEIPLKVQVSTTEAQMHRSNQVSNVPSKACHALLSHQDDWDTIEEIPGTEEQQIKEQLLDGNVFNTDNPRRSSRNRELQNNLDHKKETNKDCPNKSSVEKAESMQSKKSKSKHIWTNVNKMKKEFSKQNKENRSKLNVSIEMYKKSNGINNTKNKVSRDLAVGDNNKNPNEAKDTNNSKDNQSLQLCQVNNSAGNESTNNNELSLITSQKKYTNIEPKTSTNNCQKFAADTEREFVKIPFFKASALNPKTLDNPIASTLNKLETNNDDIKIIIKNGNTVVANIIVNKNDNNISLNFNTDKINHNRENKEFHASVCKDVITRSVQTDDVQNFARDCISSSNTAGTKKNTNSAETGAPDTFPGRSEKQKDLTVIMECSDENVSDVFELKETDQEKSVLVPNKAQIVEDDLDVFDTVSNEECYVELLNNSKRPLSKILTPSRGTKRTPLLAHKNKDTVEVAHENEPPKKKLKTISLESIGIEKLNHQMQSKTAASNVLHEVESQGTVQKKQYVPGPETQARIDTILTPGICHDLVDAGDMLSDDNEPEPIMSTPIEDNFSEDMIEDTPQKNISVLKSRNNSKIGAVNVANKNTSSKESVPESEIARNDIQGNGTLETPVTVFTSFANNVTHKSTPFARKSLNFNKKNVTDIGPTLDPEASKVEDDDQTLCPTVSQVAKTTQEKEVLANVFNKTKEKSQIRKDFCLACSTLNDYQISNTKRLCAKYGWKFVNVYVNELTHLIVPVTEGNKSQRTVKYMRSLAAGKWIVSYDWIEMCLKNNDVVKEEPFEMLDMSGFSGPRRSRMANRRDLFEGIVFYCMPPFSVLSAEVLGSILEDSGGKVVHSIDQVKVTSGGPPALLIAEPEQTPEDQFTYLANIKSVIPVNYEWVLNCLGSYSLTPIDDLIMCPKSLFVKAISHWPEALVLPD